MSTSRRGLLGFLLLLAAAITLASIGPPERVLGTSARLVYFHGAWVWSALIAFTAAAAFGLGGLLRPNMRLHRWSTGWARAGAIFWLSSLLLSLWTMQASWNGLYLDEPRWQLGVRFGVIAILVQTAISLIRRPRLASALNVLYFAALGPALLTAEAVLHPPAPITSPGSALVRLFFLALLATTSLAAWQLSALLRPRW